MAFVCLMLFPLPHVVVWDQKTTNLTTTKMFMETEQFLDTSHDVKGTTLSVVLRTPVMTVGITTGLESNMKFQRLSCLYFGTDPYMAITRTEAPPPTWVCVFILFIICSPLLREFDAVAPCIIIPDKWRTLEHTITTPRTSFFRAQSLPFSGLTSLRSGGSLPSPSYQPAYDVAAVATARPRAHTQSCPRSTVWFPRDRIVPPSKTQFVRQYYTIRQNQSLDDESCQNDNDIDRRERSAGRAWISKTS